jgi:ribosome biogenesis GTPase
MQDLVENGLVIRVTGGDVWVRMGGAVVACSLRGRFRVKEKSLQVVAGDRVAVRREPSGSVALEKVLPRDSWLSRLSERGRGSRLIVANVERLFVVASLGEPPPHPEFLNRVLAAAEWGHAPAVVVLNKIDMGGKAAAAAFRRDYELAGYDVVETSAATGHGVDALAALVGHGVYAFIGESGVGKSSLLNRLDPELDLDVREVGERTGRGRHTTAYSQLFPFREGYLADTPGMQTFRFPGDDPSGVAECFPEIARVETRCRFDTCSHTHEPGCAVKAALDAGEIGASRYASYVEIVRDLRERAANKQW